MTTDFPEVAQAITIQFKYVMKWQRGVLSYIVLGVSHRLVDIEISLWHLVLSLVVSTFLFDELIFFHR
jgi:hypothetical protein